MAVFIGSIKFLLAVCLCCVVSCENYSLDLTHFEFKKSKLPDGFKLSLNNDECAVFFPPSTDLTYAVLDHLKCGGPPKKFKAKSIVASQLDLLYKATLPSGNYLEISVSKSANSVSFQLAREVESRSAFRFEETPVLERISFLGQPYFMGGKYWWFYVANSESFDEVKQRFESTENPLYFRVFRAIQTAESPNIAFNYFDLIQLQKENAPSSSN